MIQYHAAGQHSLSSNLPQLLPHASHHLNQHPQVTVPQAGLRHPHSTVQIQLSPAQARAETLLCSERWSPSPSAAPPAAAPPPGTGRNSTEQSHFMHCLSLLVKGQGSRPTSLPLPARAAPHSLHEHWLCAAILQETVHPCPAKAHQRQAAPGACSHQGLDAPAQQKLMS